MKEASLQNNMEVFFRERKLKDKQYKIKQQEERDLNNN